MAKVLFLYKFIKTPKSIGSVTPSSRFLTGKMIQAVPWHDVNSVAELGTGTGVITGAIKDAARPDTKVLLFERDSYLRAQIRAQYPGYDTYPDAKHLHRVVQKQGIGQLDCIISGLPFANFPQLIRDELMSQIVKSLKPGGHFIAFQYSLQMKKQLSELFHVESIRFVMLNVPPAFVYVCRKK
ncbi:class I SAM-dependent methyltransferase [Paenibacillus xerothermodurans]|uniref:Phospholipid methyltransferase n=1 Tax=Paenibacillus xerothermodurans TaxID=1977292 RepID=A0A2W1P4U8_PAEXE|nr:methyltransferase [Paenibacillus xerothermodurans]PZE22188.1 phospholipid methyltransferase [Paenibacillus xerothermodurans]